jgi:hypothetical protein
MEASYLGLVKILESAYVTTAADRRLHLCVIAVSNIPSIAVPLILSYKPSRYGFSVLRTDMLLA